MNTEKTPKTGLRKVKHTIFVVILTIAFLFVALVVVAALSIGKTPSTSAKSTTAAATTTTKQIYSVGQMADVSGIKITVNKVTRNFKIKDSTPMQGNEYIAVNVTMENKTASKAQFHLNDYTLQTGNGQMIKYTWNENASWFKSGEYAVNGIETGDLIYSVKIGDKGLLLHYNNNLFGGDSLATFKLD